MAAQATGDVVLVTMPPSQDSTHITNELLYQPVYYSLSQSLGIPLVDIFKRFGSSYNAAFMADGLHPND
jgi:lysophospholipase L1-like esterase